MSEVEHVVRRAQKGRLAFVGAFVLLSCAVVYAIVVNVQQDSSITRIEHNVCARPCADNAVHTHRHYAPGYKGGDATSTPNTGNSQPSPPSGGGQTSEPPASPGILNPVTEPILPDCSVSVLGIEVCN